MGTAVGSKNDWTEQLFDFLILNAALKPYFSPSKSGRR